MKTRLLFVTLIIILIVIFFKLQLHQYASLDALKAQQANITEHHHLHPLKTALIFFLIYIAITALSLPGAAILTLAGGMIFGLLAGTLLVSFASTIGATFAFLSARFLLHETLEKRFSTKLHTINQGIEKDGAFYLLTLRLVPIFPFFVVNLALGLTKMKTAIFFPLSQLGMLPGTIVYIYAGTELAKINTLKDIFSPGLILAFTLLGLFPLISKKAIDIISQRRARAIQPQNIE